MFSMKVTGLDKLQHDLKELEHALGSLDGTIVQLKFDPNDAKSVELALQNMEEAVNQKVAPYSSNKYVTQIVASAKKHYRERILNLAKDKTDA